MVRRAGLALASFVAVVAIAAAASAATRLHATLTKPIPSGASSGAHVSIAWKLLDGAGRPVSLRRVFVKIVCPQGTDFTVARAQRTGPGLYRASAVVPPGGIGTVTVSVNGATIRISSGSR